MYKNEFNVDLSHRIEAIGHPKSCISDADEQALRRDCSANAIDPDTLESTLNFVCRERKWTREADVATDVQDLLAVSVEQNGSIDEASFKLVVDYAVAMSVPRRQALRITVREIAQRKLPVARSALASDWFEAIRSRNESS